MFFAGDFLFVLFCFGGVCRKKMTSNSSSLCRPKSHIPPVHSPHQPRLPAHQSCGRGGRPPQLQHTHRLQCLLHRLLCGLLLPCKQQRKNFSLFQCALIHRSSVCTVRENDRYAAKPLNIFYSPLIQRSYDC